MGAILVTVLSLMTIGAPGAFAGPGDCKAVGGTVVECHPNAKGRYPPRFDPCIYGETVLGQVFFYQGKYYWDGSSELDICSLRKTVKTTPTSSWPAVVRACLAGPGVPQPRKFGSTTVMRGDDGFKMPGFVGEPLGVPMGEPVEGGEGWAAGSGDGRFVVYKGASVFEPTQAAAAPGQSEPQSQNQPQSQSQSQSPSQSQTRAPSPVPAPTQAPVSVSPSTVQAQDPSPLPSPKPSTASKRPDAPAVDTTGTATAPVSFSPGGDAKAELPPLLPPLLPASDGADGAIRR